MQRAFLVSAALAALLLAGILWLGESPRANPRTAEPHANAAVQQGPSSGVREVAPAARVAVESAPADSAKLTEAAPASASATLAIRVRSPEGEPLQGACVRMAWSSSLAEGTTGVDGSCLLERPPSGVNAELDVSAEGRFPVHQARTFQEDVNVTLHPLAALEGIVRDRESGAPIRGASVEVLQGKVDGSSDGTLLTDSSGRFEGLGVPQGFTFVLSVQASGFLNSTQPFVLRPDDASVPCEIFLERSWIVRFLVQDLESGAPLPDASINGFRSNYEADERGEILVDRSLGRGELEHAIVASAPGHCETSFELRGLAQVQGAILLRLPRSCRVEGIVLDSLGAPAVGLLVTAKFAQDDFEDILNSEQASVPHADTGVVVNAHLELFSASHQSESTDPAGRFEFDGFPPDILPVELEVRRGWQLVARRALGKLGPSGHVEHVEIRLPELSGSSVHGQLLLHGEPVSGSVLWQGPTLEGRVEVAPDGTWTATDVEPGLVTFLGEVRARGHLVSEQTRARQELVVQRNAEIECILALNPPSAPIGGRVLGPSNEPHAGAAILVRSEVGSTKAVSGQDGAWSVSVPQTDRPFIVSAQVPTREGERAAQAGDLEVDFHVAPTATLRYRARNAIDGTSVASLVLRRRVGPDRFATVGMPGRNPADPEGWCQIELPEGEHELFVAPSGGSYQPCSRTIRLNTGTTTELVFDLAPACRMEIRLANEDDSLPADHWVALLREQDWDRVQWRFEGERVTWSWVGKAQGPFDPYRVFRLEELANLEVGGLAPGRYGLKLFPDDGMLEPSWIDVPVSSGFVDVRWIQR